MATEANPPLSAEAIFDAVGPAYEDAFSGLSPQTTSIKWILDQLETASIKPAKIVDIGCGTGKPVCHDLAEAGHDVLGIDISSAMLDAARERAPRARFEKLDVRDFDPPAGSYDVATAYFSLIAGVTQDEIRAIIAKIHGMLKPGGLFVFSTVPLDVNSVDISWMGKPITVSSLAPEDVVATMRSAGFEIAHQDLTQFKPRAVEAGICKEEEVWEETHLFVHAKKPQGSG